jgi:hypothetical protein
MMTPTSREKFQPVKAYLSITLALGLMLGNIATSAAGIQKPDQRQPVAWPTRDFLPPIASINPKLSEQQNNPAESDLGPVALSAVTSPAIRTTPKVNRLATEMNLSIKNEQSQAIMDIQKKVDEADLEHLWQATVEKNPVIRFSLEKLATPADLQTKHSSRFLSKTLNVLISGATMGATMLPGASAYRNMGSMAVGNALQNMTNGSTKITPNSLSATEQIQLAGLIDELKLKLIHNYQDYKNTLQTLSEAREITIKNNNLYSKALATKSDLAIMAAGSAYYQALMHETTLRQQAKLFRIQLERIAGTDAVATLALSTTVSLNGKTSSNPDEASPMPEATSAVLNTNAQLLPPAQPQATPTASSTQNDVALPQAMMEIGPHLDSDNDAMIGPPLPALTSSDSRRVKSRKVMVRNTIDSQPQPMQDKILEQPSAQSKLHKENP